MLPSSCTLTSKLYAYFQHVLQIFWIINCGVVCISNVVDGFAVYFYSSFHTVQSYLEDLPNADINQHGKQHISLSDPFSDPVSDCPQ